jgi:hypothetical protein
MPCTAPTIVVGGVVLSTNTFENAQELIKAVGSDQSDPTADEYESYIALGNNDKKSSGIQQTLPTQTTLPPPSPLPAKASNDKPPPPGPGGAVTCTIWDGVDYDVPMSEHFILRNFTVGYPNKALNEQKGCLFPYPLIDITVNSNVLDKQTRFCNLQNLAQKLLEPIYNKFGPFRINSAIRNNDSVKPPGVSQHVTGEAADIQFPGWTYEMYWANAAWIRDNLNYDQYIFEHSERSGLAWYHLSYKKTGSTRPDSTRVMTMYRGNYNSGLKRYF